MKNADLLARYNELQVRWIDLSIAEQNEARDCEIALGMIDCRPETRAEAARRCERYAAGRLAK